MPPVDTARKRLRLEDLRHDATPDGRCRLSAHLEFSGRSFVGTQEGIETHHGRIRAVAEAILRAATEASEGTIELELVGVKAVRAFDGWVVVARVNGVGVAGAYRLLGSAAAEDEASLLPASARAVLDATNRVLERHMGG